eukprot:5825446-Pleurochrysis_carterae.AAC.1
MATALGRCVGCAIPKRHSQATPPKSTLLQCACNSSVGVTAGSRRPRSREKRAFPSLPAER